MPNTREKLIELLTQAAVLGDYLDMRKVADHLIAHGVTVQQWISVKDRLPEQDGEYIVMIANFEYATALCYRTKFNEWDDGMSNYYNVTHWMPLPQPPKGE